VRCALHAWKGNAYGGREGKSKLEDVGAGGKIILKWIWNKCRSYWPRGLRYELFSPSQTLGSWIRISLEVWMFAFILYLCCPV
jgi:hypothetical protein